MEALMSQQPFYYFPSEATGRQDQGFPRHAAMPHIAIYKSIAHLMPAAAPVYSRPGSSCSQPPATAAPPQPLYGSGGPRHGTVMTPVASPRPSAHKTAGIMLDTELGDRTSPYLPSTPPLSSCGASIASIGSPGDIFQSPMNPMFSGLADMKGSFDSVDGHLSLQWSGCASPPMTPIYLHGPLTRTSTEISTTSCPSLTQSPSQSPFTRPASLEPSASFCDPRNLTVTSAAPLSLIAEPNSAGNGLSLHAAADDLPDFQPDEDFSTRLVNFATDLSCDYRRSRAGTGSSDLSLGHGSYIGDELYFEEADGFAIHCLPSPPSSCPGVEYHPSKRSKTTKMRPAVSAMAEYANAAGVAGAPDEYAESVAVSPLFSDADQPAGSAQPSPSHSSAASPSSTAGSSSSASINRRGRKQSLTNDPSKTWACDKCDRRFRRQEHLKRHTRSLHTNEKPYECAECGKKFSRSDNLAQHARTHGSGAIVMDILEDGTVHPFDNGLVSSDFGVLGHTLFRLAADVTGSGSGSSDETGVLEPKRKRKRTN